MPISSSGAVVGDDLPGYTIIGSNNVIGHHAVVGVKCQDLKYKVRMSYTLVLGERKCDKISVMHFEYQFFF